MIRNLLTVDNLRTYFHTEQGDLRAVDGVSFNIRPGTVLALVGESGCGKTVTAYSILRLIQKPGRIVGGRILLHHERGEPIDLTALSDRDELLYQIRGGVISMIFQEPMTALSPVHTIGNQIIEAILLHQSISPRQARRQAADMLARVGIPAPEERLKQYPFEMSGGMRQRTMIAMALVCRPALLIADEPTTALDVTIQAQIMNLIDSLRQEVGSAVLLITHDLGVVAQMADEVAVMYLGHIVESGPVRALLKNPRHPYTMGLLGSLPSLSRHRERLVSIPGSVPSLWEVPSGCPFHPRCSYAIPGRCDQGSCPPLVSDGPDRYNACLRIGEITVDD